MKLRPLSSRERVMGCAVAVAAFVMGNLFLLQALQEHFRQNEATIRRLDTELKLSKTWVGSQDYWSQRSAWVDHAQPKVADASQANVALLDSLQKLAAANNVAIEDQSLKEARDDANYQEASVQLRVSGSLESICRWMAAIQQPDAFQVVPTFSLRGNENDVSTLRCILTVARWYPPKATP